MLSDRSYWAFLIIIFGILAGLLWFWLIPNQFVEYNLGVNLLTSSIFMVFTVFFLSYLISLREKREWKTVKIWVRKMIGRQLYHVFNTLARFIYPKQFSPAPSKDEILKILEDLNEMEKPSLTDYAFNYYLPKPADSISLYDLKVLFKLKDYLNDLEIKYFRFMEPEICVALSEIRNELDNIESDFDLLRTDETAEDVVEKSMASSVLKIMKEIYKLHKIGIEIYRK
jgi:hypothetical protein